MLEPVADCAPDGMPNRSDDIRALFCEYCDRVGVEWRRMTQWDISVARRDSVALMDRYIGPKR